VEPTDLLTVDEIHSGIQATLELRRHMAWHGAKISAFMAGVGLLIIGAGYIKQGHVSPWAFLLPVGLAAIVVPSSLLEVRRLTLLLVALRSAEHRVLSGQVVRLQDIPGLSPAA
jgi:hypothetical protein